MQRTEMRNSLVLNDFIYHSLYTAVLFKKKIWLHFVEMIQT